MYTYLKLLKNTMKITIFSTLSKLICSLPLIISIWPMWRRLYCQRLYFLTISGMYIISGFFWKFSLHKAPLQKASTRQHWCARFSNTVLLNPWGSEGICKISWKGQCTILFSMPMMDLWYIDQGCKFQHKNCALENPTCHRKILQIDTFWCLCRDKLTSEQKSKYVGQNQNLTVFVTEQFKSYTSISIAAVRLACRDQKFLSTGFTTEMQSHWSTSYSQQW